MIHIITPSEFSGNGPVNIRLDEDVNFRFEVVTNREIQQVLVALGITTTIERVMFMSAYDVAELLSAMGFDTMVTEVEGMKKIVH